MLAPWKVHSSSGKGSAAPTGCFLHSGTQVGPNIVVYGGSNVFGEALPQLMVYSTEHHTWGVPTEEVDVNEEAGGPRYGHTATLLDMHPPRIIVFGGMLGGNTFGFVEDDGGKKKRQIKGQTLIDEDPDNSVYVLECVRDTWKWSKPLVRGKKRPLARSEHTATKVAANQLLVFGGWCGERALSDVHTLDCSSYEWSQPECSGKSPCARYRHTATLMGTRLYVLGGSDNGDDIADTTRDPSLAEIYVLDVQSWSWYTPIASGRSPLPRSGHAACAVGSSHIAVFGGKRSNDVYLGDLFLLNTESMNWTTLKHTGTKPPPLANTSMCNVGGKCYVFGGTDVRGNCCNDVLAVDLSAYQTEKQSEAEEANLSFKVIIVGDSGVGKTSLLGRFAHNEFDPEVSTTLGIDFSSKVLELEGTTAKLELWDTAGTERYSGITVSYYRGAQGAMLVYDVTNRESFEHIESWVARVHKYGGVEMDMLLVGNKLDLASEERQVSFNEAMELAKSRNIPFIETSAKTSANVYQAFSRMATNIKSKVESQKIDGIQVNMLKRKGVKLNGGHHTLNTRYSMMSIKGPGSDCC